MFRAEGGTKGLRDEGLVFEVATTSVFFWFFFGAD